MTSRRDEDRLTSSERITRAKLAAYASWANTADRPARTAPARRAYMRRFERMVDPDGILDPVERAERAKQAMRAHMTRAALRSARSRRRRRE